MMFRRVVAESVRDWLTQRRPGMALIPEEEIIFSDSYRIGGYGEYDGTVTDMIERVLDREGIPMDTTYVGKAFAGMVRYLADNGIRGRRVLFIHTGGAPLFFDRFGNEDR